MDTANTRLIQITIVCICMMRLIHTAAVECERCNNQVDKDFRLYREILRQQGILMDYIFNRTKEAQTEQEAPTETSTKAPAITSTEAINNICHEQWTFRGYCYVVVPTALTWEDALVDCQSKGGFLAIVNDYETWKFVRLQIAKAWEMYPSMPGIWLGATDQKSEGHWIWAKTGEPLAYTQWQEGKPSNDTDANCLHVFQSGDSSWGDTSCMSTNSFLCQAHV